MKGSDLQALKRKERVYLGLSLVSFFVPFTFLYYYVNTTSVNEVIKLGENIVSIYFIIFATTVFFFALSFMSWKKRNELEKR